MTRTTQQRPTFSIVTPSFNQAEFLERTIQSVLSQAGRGTEFDLKYAVVDGGSNDGSACIIRKYESELNFWCSEPDRGQSHAINKGFDQIDGDLCAYLNSDDVYLPGAFQAVARAWNEGRDADLFHGICHKIDADDRYLGEQVSDIKSLSQIVDLWNHWLRPKGNRNFIQPEVFWTRDLARLVGTFDEGRYYTMDFDYWLRGFDAGMTVHTIHQSLAAFRIHAAQKTTTRHASIRELLDCVAPYLESNDPRITPQHRRELHRHMVLTHRMLEQGEQTASQGVASLVSLAAEDPALLRSPLFWRHMRRTSKRILTGASRSRAA